MTILPSGLHILTDEGCWCNPMVSEDNSEVILTHHEPDGSTFWVSYDRRKPRHVETARVPWFRP